MVCPPTLRNKISQPPRRSGLSLESSSPWDPSRNMEAQGERPSGAHHAGLVYGRPPLYPYLYLHRAQKGAWPHLRTFLAAHPSFVYTYTKSCGFTSPQTQGCAHQQHHLLKGDRWRRGMNRSWKQAHGCLGRKYQIAPYLLKVGAEGKCVGFRWPWPFRTTDPPMELSKVEFSRRPPNLIERQ